MRYLCLLRYVDDPARSLPKAESDALIDEHLALDQALQREGKYAMAGALAPGRQARLVRVRDAKTLVTDGPFAETKEELGGFYVLEAESLEEACALAARIPTARLGSVEVRPFRQLFDDLNPPAPRTAAAWPPAVRLERRAALSLAGFGARYTAETMQRIPAQWGRFGADAGKVSTSAVGESFGLCFAWQEGSMEYVCALPARPEARLPAGWRRLDLPAQRYAVFANEGHVSGIPRLADWILGTWLPGSGERLARGFAGGVELVEWYGERFDPGTGYGDMALWIPLEG